PQQDDHAHRADERTRGPVPTREGLRHRHRAVDERAEAEADRLAQRGREQEEADRDRGAVLRSRAAERGYDARNEPRCDRDSYGDSDPTQRAREEAEPPPAHRRTEREDDDRDIERVHVALGAFTSPAPAGDRG